MYTVKTPLLVKALYADLTWNFSRKTNDVFLTFDDGPHPQITGEVISHLAKANAKATFFCVGANIEKHPGTFQQLLAENHSVGNHTYDHMNGWKNSNRQYFRSIVKCKKLVSTSLFRPPHGKITRAQARMVRKKFNIIMWDVLSADFDKTVSKEKCVDNVIKNIQPGSVVVFHDSEKAAEKMLYALPRVLDYIQEKKWNMKEIPMSKR
ncbi:MAG: polysaccharide deacetylase family protein [Flavobacteriales bacterium]